MDAEELVAHGTDEALVRHIIDFDPRAATHYRFAAAPGSEEAAALAAAVLRPDPIPWPPGLAPTTVTMTPTPADTDPLPDADVLLVTYTVAEGYAAADVLTPGTSTTGWTRYRNGWDTLKKTVKEGAPSLARGQAGLWAVTMIGTVKVVVVKSDLHPATDGTGLPIRALWRQMIDQVKPGLVITTGTAGGIGAETLLGDVVATTTVRWDCTRTFKDASFATTSYTSPTPVDMALFATATKTLIPVNAAHLPRAARPPVIVSPTTSAPVTTLTTDFFAFGDAKDHYGLRAYQSDARAVEMDDAACALACTDLAAPPGWVSVRNASDPQMNEAGITAEKKDAAAIYEKYGYWTTIGSAITCWAIIAARST